MQPGQAEAEVDPAEWAQGELQPVAQPAPNAAQLHAAEDTAVDVDRLSGSQSETEQEATANSSTGRVANGSAEGGQVQVDVADRRHNSHEATAG